VKTLYGKFRRAAKAPTDLTWNPVFHEA